MVARHSNREVEPGKHLDVVPVGKLGHSKIADGRPLSGEERSYSGHHRDGRV
jgi:hypothetical protein